MYILSVLSAENSFLQIPGLPIAALDPMVFAFGGGGLLVGVLIALLLSRFLGKTALNRSQAESQRLLEDARKQSSDLIKQAQLTAKDEALKLREQADREVETAREETRKIEERLLKREDTLDQKLDTLTTKEKNLENLERSLTERNRNLQAKEQQVDQALAREKEVLLQITNLSVEDAKQLLLKRV